MSGTLIESRIEPLKAYAEANDETLEEAKAAYHRGCDLVRQDRQTQITIVSVLAATVYLASTRRRPAEPALQESADE